LPTPARHRALRVAREGFFVYYYCSRSISTIDRLDETAHESGSVRAIHLNRVTSFNMNTTTRIAVVTGTNRGLGLETCRQLAAQGIRVMMTSRSEEKGRQTAERLQAEGLDVVFFPLDVTDPDGPMRLSAYVRETFGRLDILVNNAGIFPDPWGTEVSSVFRADVATVRAAMETNTYGALRLMQALIPLMQGSGNVVNVSSGMGQLSDMNGCCPGYRLSKSGLNALTRIFADELRDTGVKINSVCPGWVRTDMGGSNAERSVEQGAQGIVWAATLDESGPSGGFFRDGKAIPW
jgi:NAD(P)-dependent dehydrogenase (short-subunit alcohol dehydrogenase family)